MRRVESRRSQTTLVTGIWYRTMAKFDLSIRRSYRERRLKLALGTKGLIGVGCCLKPVRFTQHDNGDLTACTHVREREREREKERERERERGYRLQGEFCGTYDTRCTCTAVCKQAQPIMLVEAWCGKSCDEWRRLNSRNKIRRFAGGRDQR